MNVKNFNNNNFRFSKTFQKLISKYLKYEKKRKIKIELMKNPNKIILEEIYKKKRQIKIKEEDFFKSLSIGEKIDFDTQKFLKSRPKEEKMQYISDKKKVSKYLFFKKSKNNLIKENERNYFNPKKIMYKSLSQNLAPSIQKYNNIKLLQFPKIFPEKENEKNNLLFKAKSLNDLNYNKNENNTLKSFFSFSGYKTDINALPQRPLKKAYTKFLFKTNYSNKIFNNQNKRNYYNRLNLLTNKSKEISNNLSFYSINENDFINEQIKKAEKIKQKYM